MPRPTVHRTPFGSTHGIPTDLWTLDSGTGVRAEILTYGASLHSLTVPDTAGATASVVRSLETLDDYTAKHPYFGAVVGRYANRIAHGRFVLDGTEHHIPANDRGHALHGGPTASTPRCGRPRRTGPATARPSGSPCTARTATWASPGGLDATVTYTLDTEGTLAVEYTSVTDRPTVVNLTNHAYFELAGSGDIRGHRLEVDADAYLPVDDDGIPLGPPADVRGTPFDLTGPRVLADCLGEEDDQLRGGRLRPLLGPA